jgi:hypothetical protein
VLLHELCREGDGRVLIGEATAAFLEAGKRRVPWRFSAAPYERRRTPLPRRAAHAAARLRPAAGAMHALAPAARAAAARCCEGLPPPLRALRAAC